MPTRWLGSGSWSGGPSRILKGKLERIRPVGDRGHIALDAFASIRLGEVPSDLGVFVLVIDEDSALSDGHVDPALAVLRALSGHGATPPIYGHVASRHFARAHMLVEIGVRRNVDAVRTPVHLDHLVAVAVLPGVDSQLPRPDIHVTVALQSDQHGARAVVMRLVVSADRPLRNMAGGEAARHPVASKLAAGDLLFQVLNPLLTHVGDV